MPASLARAATAVELSGAEPPSEIELMPAGRVRVRPRDGRADWHNPDPAAVVRATESMGEALAIDYEHQGELSRENGQPTPAAG